jgi:septal ring factor EnvC (AmiA/AmiB activator)
MLVKVDESSFLRDTNSMALLNLDKSAKEEYYLKSKLLNTQKEEINKINNEIDSLKTDISDIKNMLIQILSDKN